MSTQKNPRTSEINGKFWGASALDWSEIQEQTCSTVYHAVFDHLVLGDEDHYLDVGCGSGMAASYAAERGARVSGVDAAESLLEIARKRTPDAEFHLTDIESLPFEDNTFTFVTGFNAFQYAGNPPVALAEAKRVASSGANVVIVTWGEPEGMEAAQLVASLKPLLPPPPPGAPGPFALSDENLLREFAALAELEPVEVFDVDSPWVYPDLDTAMRGLRSSGVAARAIEISGLDAVNQAHQNVLETFVKDDGSLEIGATFRCLIARA